MSNFNFLGNFLGKKSDFKKDGHDMSNTEAFHQSFGRWNAIKCIDVVPGEHYKVSVDGYIQTAPMREDNFMQITNNLKAVFVPLSSVYRDFMSSTQADRSTRKDGVFSSGCDQLRIDSDQILSYMYMLYLNFNIYKDFKNLCESYNLDSQNIYIHYDTDSDNAYVQLQNYLLNPPVGGEAIEIKIVDGTDYLFNIDDYPYAAAYIKNQRTSLDGYSTAISSMAWYIEHNQSFGRNYILWDILSTLDMLGYPNFLPILVQKFQIDARYAGSLVPENNQLGRYCFHTVTDDGSVKMYITDYDPVDNDWGTFFEWTFFDLTPILALRLYQYSHLTSNYVKPFTNVITYDSLYPYAKVDSLSFCNELLYVDIYKFLSNDSAAFISIDNNTLFELLTSQLDLDEIGAFDFLNYLFSNPNPLLSPDLFTTMVDSVVQGSIPSVTSSSLQQNLVQTLADTSALYKLRQDLKRAGVRRDKQIEVIFGVKSHHDPLVPECYELGSSSKDINITSLINQAETEQAPLGARASRGNGATGLTFELDTETPGWIFIISSFTCPTFYENFMFDRNRLNSFEAAFDPRFNHLGLEAVKRFDCSVVRTDDAYKYNEGITNDNIGYSARYFYYKQAVNKVHGLFTNFGMLIPQVNPDGSIRVIPQSLQRGSALFGGFLSTVISQQVNAFQSFSDLYYDPTMVNNIFTQMVDPMTNSEPIYDQFRCIFHYNVHKVSPMPKLGLLKLDV